MTTVHEIVSQHANATPEALVAALLAREDEMRDRLYLAGAQFGLFPFIVTEVLAEVGLGTPPSEAERAMIHHNFVAGMEDLQRQQREGQ